MLIKKKKSLIPASNFAGRAVGDPEVAHMSNFLHPVFYYYPELPTRSASEEELVLHFAF